MSGTVSVSRNTDVVQISKNSFQRSYLKVLLLRCVSSVCQQYEPLDLHWSFARHSCCVFVYGLRTHLHLFCLHSWKGSLLQSGRSLQLLVEMCLWKVQTIRLKHLSTSVIARKIIGRLSLLYVYAAKRRSRKTRRLNEYRNGFVQSSLRIKTQNSEESAAVDEQMKSSNISTDS